MERRSRNTLIIIIIIKYVGGKGGKVSRNSI